MKEIRKSALNWALIGFGATLLIGRMIILGSWPLPALTDGGYTVPLGDHVSFVMPRISPDFWLIIIPLSVFTFRYFLEYVMDKFLWDDDFGLAMCLGILFGVLLAVVSTDGTTLTHLVVKLVLSVSFAIGTWLSFLIVRGLARDGEIWLGFHATIMGSICAAIQCLVYGIFVSPNHIEWIIGTIFGFVPISLALGFLLSSVIPMLQAIVERIFSKHFWNGLAKAFLYLFRTIVPNGAPST